VKQSELLGVFLRLLQPPASPAEGPRLPLNPPSAHPLHVLLAEDNAINRLLVVRLLEKHGHSVVVASNGREALERLEQQRFDVALMDVQMPEIGGFEATTTLRERERLRGGHLPVVAMTAHAMKGDRERCLAAGMDEYLAKPIQPSTLFECLERVAIGRAAPGSADLFGTNQPAT
jgi:two-component system, sensor histidine kinase and response regulator